MLVRPALPGLPKLARELRAAGRRPTAPHPAPPAGDDLRRGHRAGPELVPTGEELLAAVRELLGVAAEIGLIVDNLSSWRRRIGTRNDLCTAGCRDLCDRPGRPRPRLRHHRRRPRVRRRLPARAAARRDLAHVRQPAAAARRARPRPGRVPRLPGRRRLRRRVLGAGALRGACPRRGRRVRRAVPLLRPRPAAPRGAYVGGRSRRSCRERLRRRRRLRRPIRGRRHDYALFDCI